MLNRLLSISSILLFFYGYAQKKVELSINPSSVEVGETFSITVKSNVQGELKFDKVPSSFIQDYNIRQGSSREMDVNTGNLKVIYFYTFTGVITTSGKYTIGPAYITNGSRSYASNEASITVGKRVPMSSGDVSTNQLEDPAFGLIQVNKKTIYEGEPLLILAKIYSTYNPSHVGAYTSYTVPGTTIKYPIGNTTSFKKSIEKFKGEDYFAFAYDKNVIFPSGIGMYRIDPFQMNLHKGYQNFPLTSNGYDITILPLPSNAPANFLGLVGDFNVERVIEAKGLKQGDFLKLIITISGIGNLQNCLEPSLNLPKGFSEYGDPVITETKTIGAHGFEGVTVYEFNIEVKKFGDLSLPATTLSYFDPATKKYVEAKLKAIDFNVERNGNYIVHEETDNAEKDTELIIHRSKIKENALLVEAGSFYESTAFWGWVGTPILASFFFLFLVRRKDQSEDKSIAKKQKVEKDNAFKERVAVAKSMLETGSDSEYYSEVENALRKAFEIEMNFKEDRFLNKDDINNFINQSGTPEIQQTVNSIFSNCEQSKYGFSTTNTSRSEILDELKEVVGKLNQVKW